MGAKPQARSEQLVVEELDHGAVVYDTVSSQAHWLNEGSLRVWRACDGWRDAAELAQSTGVGEGQVTVCLSELRERGLLRSEGVSRRAAIKRAAAMGAAAATAAPVISTVIIPTAAAHASTGTGTGSGTGTTGGGTVPGTAQLQIQGRSGLGPFTWTVSGGTQPAQSGTLAVGKLLEFSPDGRVIDPAATDPGYFGIRFSSDGSFTISNQAAQPAGWNFQDVTVPSVRGSGTLATGSSETHTVPVGDQLVFSASFGTTPAPTHTVVITAGSPNSAGTEEIDVSRDGHFPEKYDLLLGATSTVYLDPSHPSSGKIVIVNNAFNSDSVTNNTGSTAAVTGPASPPTLAPGATATISQPYSISVAF